MRDDDVLTTAAAAKLLNLTPDGVRWLERKGQLRLWRTTTSGQRLFLRSDVLRVLARRDAAAAASPKDAA